MKKRGQLPILRGLPTLGLWFTEGISGAEPIHSCGSLPSKGRCNFRFGRNSYFELKSKGLFVLMGHPGSLCRPSLRMPGRFGFQLTTSGHDVFSPSGTDRR